MVGFLKSLFSGGVSGIHAADLQAKLGSKEAPYILDVRQPNEFRAGHIAGAKLIPLDQLAAKTEQLPKDREIVCVCRSGARSGAAARQLTQAGYKAVNLSGGMSAWEMAKLPVKKG